MQDDTIHPRRILYVDHTAKLGGGEIALLYLVQHLSLERYLPIVLLSSDGPLREKLEESGVEVSVMPISDSILETRKDTLGISALLRLRDLWLLLVYTVKLARFIREQRIDLVHTNSLKADLLGGVAARLARVPLLWHIRDRIDRDYLPGPVVAIFRWLCSWLPNYVVANSESTLQTLKLRKPAQAAVYSGIEIETRVRVVHDGVKHIDQHFGSAGESSQAWDEALPEKSTAIVIGLVGRISPWKGQHIFLQAAARVQARFPQARFQIIGSAMFGEEAYEQEIRALVCRLGIDSCVDFLGFRNDIPDLIRGMDILVHASTSAEPFGQVIVEGMAAAKPVIATNGGGATEIVVDGVTGLLVPMADVEAMATAILFLIENPEAALVMGWCGHQRACELFTIEHTVRKIEEIYEKIFPGRTTALKDFSTEKELDLEKVAHSHAREADSLPLAGR